MRVCIEPTLGGELVALSHQIGIMQTKAGIHMIFGRRICALNIEVVSCLTLFVTAAQFEGYFGFKEIPNALLSCEMAKFYYDALKGRYLKNTSKALANLKSPRQIITPFLRIHSKHGKGVETPTSI